jgi:hypothetical protein
MNATETIVKEKKYHAGATRVDIKLEVEIVPVSDVDRAKEFYQQKLGWRLDIDDTAGENFRVVQLTPPGARVAQSFSVRESAQRRLARSAVG